MTNRKKLHIYILCLTLLCLGFLTGCGTQAENVPPVSTRLPEDVCQEEDDSGKDQGAPEDTDDESPVESEQPSAKPEQPPAESELPQAEDILTVSDRDAIKEELTDSIRQLRQPRSMNISGAGLASPALDVKNIYYEIMAQAPDLKYAFDLTAEVRESELTCVIHYMPYKNGAFPADFSGKEVSTLEALLDVADENMGDEPVSVRITNPALEPDTMNRALQQVGGGYVNCILNADATAIRYSAPIGMTIADCLDALELTYQLADEVIAQVITEDMTQREQVKALYSYVTQTVKYDQRYYSDKANMPYESQTALGALRDGLAICGGYSHAVKLLLEKVGIPCFNVTGYYFRENHMWNYVVLDGEGYYCDSTADRGGMSNHFMLTADELTALGKHSWDHEYIAKISNTDEVPAKKPA